MVTKRNGDLAPLKLPGFTCSHSGLVANKTLTQEQWATVGQSLSTIEAKLSWYVGDWLAASKGEAWGYGDLEAVCEEFGLNYSSAQHAKSVADAFEFSRRRLNLTFSHHQEVQGRDDADELLDWCEETDPPRSIKELREEKKQRKRVALEAKDIPSGKYTVIYADPPWEYNSGDNHTHTTQATTLADHYPSMPLDLICAMDVQSLSAEFCTLFIWTTSPTLEECFQVINAWGFEYKASMIWDKVKHNVGHYVSVRHELLLICTRGQTPHIPTLVDSVYEEERTEHSRKPEYFRTVIESMHPKAKRLELFAREKCSGWKAWGNEVQDGEV